MLLNTILQRTLPAVFYSTALMLLATVLMPHAHAASMEDQLKLLDQLSPSQREAARRLLQDQKKEELLVEPIEEPEVVIPRFLDRKSRKEQDKKDDTKKTGKKEDEEKEFEDVIVEPLKPFGYDLFAGEPLTFAPATDIPIPVDYIVGPGDTVRIQLFGKSNEEYELVVSREGILNFPEIGPISVNGLRFGQLQDDLQKRVAAQMIGVKASVTLGSLRSIRIFVLGDAHRPGSYTVSALSTITNALFVSGGIDPIGSLRNILLKRNGKVIRKLDLYDLLLKGDTSTDERLLPGDVIFVPPVQKMVGVAGEVHRPAKYELVKEKRIEELLALAGGLTSNAYPQSSQLERISANNQRTIIDINLKQEHDLKREIQGGDIVRIFSILDNLDEVVLLSGHVERPGGRQWREGMRLSDVIPSPKVLLPQADLSYVLVRRESVDGRIALFSVNLAAALRQPGSDIDPLLDERDEVIVFSLSEDRTTKLEPLLEQLRIQANQDNPMREVSINGRVRAPGQYPLEDGMRVSDLIRAGGSLQEAAYTKTAELTRYGIGDDNQRTTQHIKVDLSAILKGNAKMDLVLHPHDVLNIKDTPQWTEVEEVELIGEVKFPGVYPIARGEQLSSVIQRAGGLSDLAYAEGSVFVREELRIKEKAQLAKLAARLELELTTKSIRSNPEDEKGIPPEAVEIASELLKEVRSSEAVGRLVINLPQILRESRATRRSDADVTLKHGDKLYIPKYKQEVTVLGEVFFPTSHLHKKGRTRDDYINLSGGTTRTADDDLIYVVRASGAVISAKANTSFGESWFDSADSQQIRPGDTIIVPVNIDPIKPLTLWTSISQIVYQLVFSAASLNAIGAF